MIKYTGRNLLDEQRHVFTVRPTTHGTRVAHGVHAVFI
jgi:hypothetical protein